MFSRLIALVLITTLVSCASNTHKKVDYDQALKMKTIRLDRL